MSEGVTDECVCVCLLMCVRLYIPPPRFVRAAISLSLLTVANFEQYIYNLGGEIKGFGNGEEKLRGLDS